MTNQELIDELRRLNTIYIDHDENFCAREHNRRLYIDMSIDELEENLKK